MEGDVIGDRVDLLVVAVPAGDLEGHGGHLPRFARDLQALLDASHLEDVDLGRAEGQRAPDGDGVHEASVEEVLAVDLDRGEDSWNGTGGEQRGCDRSGGEPARLARLDVC